MALRPPSNQRPRDEYFSGDPAFVQFARGDLDLVASTKARAEYDRKLTRARETGDWKELAVDGVQPTKFVMRPISSALARLLVDKLNSSAIGNSTASQIAFRASIDKIENCGDITVTPSEHPIWGRIASESVTDFLDAIDTSIVSELGFLALMRANTPSPK